MMRDCEAFPDAATVNVLVLGPQGSGKGTQAKRISAAHGVPHVSTGDMFRSAIAARTELGLQVEPILASGVLVPDELTIAMIRDRLSWDDALAGFVLDGFPRNLVQAVRRVVQMDEGNLAPVHRLEQRPRRFGVQDAPAVEQEPAALPAHGVAQLDCPCEGGE